MQTQQINNLIRTIPLTYADIFVAIYHSQFILLRWQDMNVGETNSQLPECFISSFV
jgi:hypothetical protein